MISGSACHASKPLPRQRAPHRTAAAALVQRRISSRRPPASTTAPVSRPCHAAVNLPCQPEIARLPSSPHVRLSLPARQNRPGPGAPKISAPLRALLPSRKSSGRLSCSQFSCGTSSGSCSHCAIYIKHAACRVALRLILESSHTVQVVCCPERHGSAMHCQPYSSSQALEVTV